MDSGHEVMPMERQNGRVIRFGVFEADGDEAGAKGSKEGLLKLGWRGYVRAVELAEGDSQSNLPGSDGTSGNSSARRSNLKSKAFDHREARTDLR